MQIPLDFYRILGVSTRATLEQLQQAFEDRLQQMPRPEYSTAAIATRKQLIEEAFVVLADPQKRQAYDESWDGIETSSDAEPTTHPTLNVPETQLSGVLLLLQEMGAYQQILDLGSTYLQRPIDLAKVPTNAGALEEDVILAMSLANLELGREQWQQSQFEAAGDSLQTGLALLDQEQRFPDVQAEICGDLYKLRPYRILELLNDPETESSARTKGLTLLQAMLDDRDGIDGNQDDQSGLSVNDFLRFIQQLREYLTAAEQQALFEKEAKRPSAVASYLAVYALIARGVSIGKPNLIGRAKDLLSQLGDRQDIALEQGMCWLLLGQPEAAHNSVLLSQDEESLNFLRQYSEGAPDLIPGLYLYTENWLQQEVYPYFRDLSGQSVSLQSYFDDPAIQLALSTLETHPVGQSIERTQVTPTSARLTPTPHPEPTPAQPNLTTKQTTASSSPPERFMPDPLAGLFEEEMPDWAKGIVAGKPLNTSPSETLPAPQPKGAQRPSGATQPRSPAGKPPSARKPKQPRPQRETAQAQRRGWVFWAIATLLGFGFVAGALALGRIINPKLFTATQDIPAPSPSIAIVPPSPVQSPSLLPSSGTSASVSPSPIASASGQPSLAPNPDSLSTPDATELIETWQATKAEAMGQGYDGSKLTQILAEPVLSDWKSRVAQNKASEGYWKYTLDKLEVQAVEPRGQGRVAVKAVVKETAQYYERGQLVADQSYTDTYPVQYTLTRRDQQWLIKDMQVLR